MQKRSQEVLTSHKISNILHSFVLAHGNIRHSPLQKAAMFDSACKRSVVIVLSLLLASSSNAQTGPARISGGVAAGNILTRGCAVLPAHRQGCPCQRHRRPARHYW